MDDKVEIIGNGMSPYAQYPMIVLEEKQHSYETVFVDLQNKPDWFLEISPLTKVPLLRLDEGLVLFDSAVISEYLDETIAPHLLPADPTKLAQQRMWIEFGGELVATLAKIYRALDETDFSEARSVFRNLLSQLEVGFKSLAGNGPYFGGETFSLVGQIEISFLEFFYPLVFPSLCASYFSLSLVIKI